MAVKAFEKFTGGLTTDNARDVEDDQFVVLKNMFYNENRRLQSRRGVKNFGTSTGTDPGTSIFSFTRDDTDEDIMLVGAGTNLYRYNESADTWTTLDTWFTEFNNVVVLNSCESTSDSFTGTADAQNVSFATTDPRRGLRALEFDIGDSDTPTNPTGTTAVLTSNLATARDLTNYEDTGVIRFWFKAVNSSKISNVTLRWGSDSSNYWEQSSTLSVQGEALSNFYKYLEFAWSSATQTGSPDVTAVDYLEIIITHTATTPIANLQIDEIAVYPTNNVAGSERTRWGFAIYLNNVLLANGIDPYTVLSTPNNDVAIEGVIHGRYVANLQDRLYISGDDVDMSKVEYTNASPTNADSSGFTNSVIVGGDEAGRVNVIDELANTILIGKEGKSYDLDVANSSALPIDSTKGMYADRATQSIGSSKIYASKNGLEFLTSRSGVSSTSGVDTKPVSNDLQGKYNLITSRQRNTSCGWYHQPTYNYYFTYDSNDDFIPDSTLVYNAQGGVEAFSEYSWPSIYQYTEFRDSNGNYRFLAVQASDGQLIELETGFTDNGVAIACELKTKEFDFGLPEVTKEFHLVYIFGKMSDGGSIDIEILVDGQIASSDTVGSDHLSTTSGAVSIAEKAIGSSSVGGGVQGANDVDIYPYKIGIPVYSGGETIQVRMTSETEAQVWTMERMTFDYDDTTFDLFPFVIPS